MMSHTTLGRTAAACAILLLLASCVDLSCLKIPDLEKVQDPESGYAFPTASEIAEVRVSNGAMLLDFEDFDAPERHWPRMLAALSPSQYDPKPADWRGRIDLEIRTKNGGLLTVSVFELEDTPVGAFMVDAPPPHGIKYYRGGNSTRFAEAITAALEDTEE